MDRTADHRPWDGAPLYMIRDRGRIYGAIVTRRLRAMGIQASRTSCSDRMSVPGLISDVAGFMRKIV